MSAGKISVCSRFCPTSCSKSRHFSLVIAVHMIKEINGFVPTLQIMKRSAMAEALVNSLAAAGNLNDMPTAETQVPGIKTMDDLITTLTRLAEDRTPSSLDLWPARKGQGARHPRRKGKNPTKKLCIPLVPRSEVLYGRRFWSFYNSSTAS